MNVIFEASERIEWFRYTVRLQHIFISYIKGKEIKEEIRLFWDGKSHQPQARHRMA